MHDKETAKNKQRVRTRWYEDCVRLDESSVQSNGYQFTRTAGLVRVQSTRSLLPETKLIKSADKS
jgi:hypothetical protein